MTHDPAPLLQKEKTRWQNRCCRLLVHLASLFPIATWLPKYNWRKDFFHDFIAGLTVGVVAVPQSLSYATVAGLPAKYGMYNGLVGLLPYAFFGSSRHLITGPTAVMSIIVKGIVPQHIASTKVGRTVGGARKVAGQGSKAREAGTLCGAGAM